MAYLLTLAEYHSLMGVATSDTSKDVQIEALIAAVDNEITTYLGYAVTTATFTETLNGTGATFLRLRNIPITSITTVTLDYNLSTATSYDGSNFIYNSQGLVYFKPSVVTLPGYFDVGVMNVQVVYTAGYAVADVPQAIKLAACLMVQRSMDITNPANMNSFKLDQYSQETKVVSINDAKQADIRRILDGLFKKVVFI